MKKILLLAMLGSLRVVGVLQRKCTYSIQKKDKEFLKKKALKRV
jgi:hypothetical protein